MKQNVFFIGALLIAVAFSSFDVTKQSESTIHSKAAQSVYAVYDGSGAQNDPFNYPAFSSMPTVPPPPCDGSARLCWFRIDDVDLDNDIDLYDLIISFMLLDFSGNGSLDDEPEIPGRLEKRS